MPNETPDYVAPFDFVGEADIVEGEVDVSVSTVDELPPLPFPIDIPEPSEGQYWSYGVSVAYQRDRGLRVAPAAGPKGTLASVWRTHSGFAVKIVLYACEMIGAKPPIPAPVTCDNEILIDDVHAVPAPIRNLDGTYVYTRVGQYTFLLQQMPDDSDILWGAVTPLDTAGIAQNYIDPASLVHNLIGPINNPNSFTGSAITF